MGGGTVLAAQWGHRLSVDIDVWLPGRKTFINLLQHDERNVVGWLGGEPGEPESVDAEQAGVTTAFAHGPIALSTRRTRPAAGAR